MMRGKREFMWERRFAEGKYYEELCRRIREGIEHERN